MLRRWNGWLSNWKITHLYINHLMRKTNSGAIKNRQQKQPLTQKIEISQNPERTLLIN